MFIWSLNQANYSNQALRLTNSVPFNYISLNKSCETGFNHWSSVSSHSSLSDVDISSCVKLEPNLKLIWSLLRRLSKLSSLSWNSNLANGQIEQFLTLGDSWWRRCCCCYESLTDSSIYNYQPAKQFEVEMEWPQLTYNWSDSSDSWS